MYKDYSKVIKQDIYYTNTSNEDYESINNSIRNILLTLKGTLPGKPEFGSNITAYTFEQIDFITKDIIEEDILSSLYEFEPRIQVINIDINAVPEYNKFVININYEFSVKNIAKTASTAISITA